MKAQLFAIKFVHTLVFLFMSACLLVIVYCGLTQTYGWPLGLALGAIALEAVVFLGNGRRCPLTDLARQYGDATGNDFIADIFLPAWAAQKIVPVSSVILLIGLALLVVPR